LRDGRDPISSKKHSKPDFPSSPKRQRSQTHSETIAEQRLANCSNQGGADRIEAELQKLRDRLRAQLRAKVAEVQQKLERPKRWQGRRFETAETVGGNPRTYSPIASHHCNGRWRSAPPRRIARPLPDVLMGGPRKAHGRALLEASPDAHQCRTKGFVTREGRASARRREPDPSRDFNTRIPKGRGAKSKYVKLTEKLEQAAEP
jgi:hypothetical protein